LHRKLKSRHLQMIAIGGQSQDSHRGCQTYTYVY
jgi:hypothetical protein